MPRALVVYATRTEQTRQIAEYIAEGIRFTGAEAIAVNVKKIRTEADLVGYDAYVFGSPTYHGEMLEAMKTMLFLAEKAELQGKVGGAFGAYGWSGEALERIYGTMQNVFRMHMVSDPLRLKSGLLGGGMQMAQAYGREIGKKLMS
jgi:NAD(P)H dehydrogenase (quinone)